MKIALADDHALFRAGLRSALGEAFGTETEVLEASDFAGLQGLLSDCVGLDLVLCDLCMPGMDPASGVRSLVELRPEVPLVVVSASERPEDARRALKQGAKGYIFKSDSLAVLERALELVLAGGAYAPVAALLASGDTAEAAAGNVVVGGGAADSVAGVKGVAALPTLSRRQMMIFERLVEGKPNKLIARELGIAEGTVKAQLRTVFRKLGVSNRTQAALFAAEIFGKDRRSAAASGMASQAAVGNGVLIGAEAANGLSRGSQRFIHFEYGD